MIRKIISIDLTPIEHHAKAFGFPYLPITEIIAYCRSCGEIDILETLVPLVRRVPSDSTDESISKVTTAFSNKQYALQLSGARVIECSSKSSSSSATGYKQSDDQRLMLTTLMLCMKLKPDYLMLFAADGDFAPMVEILRSEGIRTEVVAPLDSLAGELKRYATKIYDFDEMLATIKDKFWNNGEFGVETDRNAHSPKRIPSDASLQCVSSSDIE